MNKYRNKPCEIGGEKYRSQREAKRHQDLLLLQKGGALRNLRREVVYVLADPVVIGGRRRPALRYVADFVYEKTCAVAWTHEGTRMPFWEVIVEDAKGVRTEGYRIKRHLMKSVHGIDILET